MAQTTSNGNKTDKPVNRPAHTIRYGAVRAAIWRNIVDNGNASRPLYCVTFSRSYKDGENNWKESGSFGTDTCFFSPKLRMKRIHGSLCSDPPMFVWLDNQHR